MTKARALRVAYQIQTLEKVDASNNVIKALPPTVNKASSLTQLIVRNNKIRGLPKTINKCPVLENLDCSYNLVKVHLSVCLSLFV